MFAERRAFPRVNVICKISIAIGERLLTLHSHTENISAGGIRIIIEEKLAPYTVVDLELFLLDWTKPLKCTGQVVWVNEIKPSEIKPHLSDTGIKFIEISESDQEQIQQFVNTILSRGV